MSEKEKKVRKILCKHEQDTLGCAKFCDKEDGHCVEFDEATKELLAIFRLPKEDKVILEELSRAQFNEWAVSIGKFAMRLLAKLDFEEE